jgi:hypothetical protein
MSMRLSRMRNIDVLHAPPCDLLLCASTLEPRGQVIAAAISRLAKERWWIQQTISCAPTGALPGEMCVGVEALRQSLRQWFVTKSDGMPSIGIDVSCLSRPAMAAIFEVIAEVACQRPLSLQVWYVIAEFTPPPACLPPNEDIRPISDYFAGWPSDANSSTSLVVGLGYERDKAEGACEFFDAGETWILVPKSPIVEFDGAVFENNKELLKRAERRTLDYRVDLPAETFGQLVGTVSNILPRMSPVLLPFGPKIFFAISLLVASIYREIGVWHVTGDAELPSTTHLASKHTVGFQMDLGPGIEI